MRDSFSVYFTRVFGNDRYELSRFHYSIGSSNYAERKILSNTHLQPGSFVLRIRKPW
jgi:hypothetical protein